MATLGSLLTDVRNRLDETTSGQWTDAELRSWINEGARDVSRRTETLQTSSDLTVVADTQEYTLPVDTLRVHRAEWRPTASSQVYPLDYRDFNSMDSIWWSSQTTTTGYPTFYTMWGYPPGLKVVLYPTPSEAGTLKVFYYKTTTDLATDGTADSSTVTIPSGYEDLVSLYCEMVALRKDRDSRWQESRLLYKDTLDNLIDNTRRWTDQGDFIQVGSRYLPGWLYNDG